MPAENDDLEPRVSALERQAAETRARLARAEADASAARVLAAGADRDVSEVRAELGVHLRLLNALGESQSQMRAEMRSEFADVRAEMRTGFAETRAGFAALAALIGGLAP